MQTRQHRNLYRLEGFFTPDACARVRHAMDDGTREDAEVLRVDRERDVEDAREAREHEGREDEGREEIAAEDSVRRAASIEIAPAVLEEVEHRLDTQREPITAFFGIPLGEREGCGFVRYPDGGFYRPHRDRADVPSWPGAARRMVAVVVFLNGGFDGGVLRLYVEGGPLDIHAEAGMLVAFPADLLHEVTVVRGGPRDAIVDWYYAPSAQPGASVVLEV